MEHSSATAKKERTAYEQYLTDWRTVLKLPEGRRVLNRILAHTHVMGRSYAAGDALGTAYNEGLRAVGLTIKDEMDNAVPGEFARLLLENTQPKGGE